MPSSYSQNKAHIYKWKESHPDYAKSYYEENKQTNFEKSNGRRRYLTEAKRFRLILFEL